MAVGWKIFFRVPQAFKRRGKTCTMGWVGERAMVIEELVDR